MSSFAYVAVNPEGLETRGTLEVPDQTEALKRIKEMGLFPTKLFEERAVVAGGIRVRRTGNQQVRRPGLARLGAGGRLAPSTLAVFTRQLATLIEAGMPMLRGLKILEEQSEEPRLKRILDAVSAEITNGGSLAEALAAHPRAFNRLYVNMVKAGELSGSLDVTLEHLAQFMEKSQRIKGRIKAALFYPGAVLTVAAAIVVLLMVFVIPRFKEVFNGLMPGRPLPGFTRFVLGMSEAVRVHFATTTALIGASMIAFVLFLKTKWGRYAFDSLKLSFPILGPVFRKAAISRFARTLGTLVGNGVPILQALTIVKETVGNFVLSRIVASVHESVKQGDPISPTLKATRIFPALVAGMVDVGEQTGALPDMLMKIADNYDQEVDDAASAMTSLLEPILLVFLAVVVGSIVIAMFLPILTIITDFDAPDTRGEMGRGPGGP